MAYEKHTWECDELITADKLNHMEDGIEDASQSPFAIVRLSATGFSSGTKDFAYLEYAIYDTENGRWQFINSSGYYHYIQGFSEPTEIALPPLPIPPSGDMYPFIILADPTMTVVTTGGVSNASESVYYEWGSYTQAYRITGSGSIQFVAGS